jgi:hypothetical protein
MVQFFPHVWIKPEYVGKYEICWTHNSHTNAINGASFEIDQDPLPINPFDPVWLDFYYSYFIERGFREHHDVCIGNVPMMEDWCSELKPYESSLVHPWFYSHEPKLAFPLFYCGKDTSVTHIYEMKTRVSDLLRMRMLMTNKDGKDVWVELKDIDFKVLGGITKDTKFKHPELWARYEFLTDEEISFLKDCNEETMNEDYERLYYINDIVACDQMNSETYNKSIEVALACGNPCNAIFWAAENLEASERRNFSNYTTNTSDMRSGWNPINTVSLYYKDKAKFKDMKSLHFDRIEPFSMYSPPSMADYNLYKTASQCFSTDVEVGVCYSELGAKMLFKLKNTDPQVITIPKPEVLPSLSEIKEYESEKEDYNTATSQTTIASYVDSQNHLVSTQPQFKIRVRMLVTRKLIIRKDGDKKYKFEVI